MAFKYNSAYYKQWRARIFKRDKYECQLCEQKGTLNAHHIKRKCDFPDLAYDKKNGIALCEKCHHIITGYEQVFEPLFQNIVNRTLSLDYIYTFFGYLTTQYPQAVAAFKKQNRWLQIPHTIIKRIKIDNDNKDSEPIRNRPKRPVSKRAA